MTSRVLIHFTPLWCLHTWVGLWQGLFGSKEHNQETQNSSEARLRDKNCPRLHWSSQAQADSNPTLRAKQRSGAWVPACLAEMTVVQRSSSSLWCPPGFQWSEHRLLSQSEMSSPVYLHLQDHPWSLTQLPMCTGFLQLDGFSFVMHTPSTASPIMLSLNWWSVSPTGCMSSLHELCLMTYVSPDSSG